MDDRNSSTQRISKILLDRYNLRVEPEMGAYLLRKLHKKQDAAIPVIGGDARTGIAIRQLVAANEILGHLQEAPLA